MRIARSGGNPAAVEPYRAATIKIDFKRRDDQRAEIDGRGSGSDAEAYSTSLISSEPPRTSPCE